MDESNQSPPGLPGSVFVIPALVVLAVAGFALKVASGPANMNKLGEVFGLYFGAIPEGICFISVYFWMIYYLRARRPQWGSALAVGAATLLGLAVCASAVVLLFGAFALEAALR